MVAQADGVLAGIQGLGHRPHPASEQDAIQMDVQVAQARDTAAAACRH